jgi:uncharacterized Ntn-hydrolase superfamily protein
MVGVISADSSSLAWLGSECDRLAGTVVSAAPAVSGGFRATSAAVQAVHSEVEWAAQRIADRLRSTGEKMSGAGRAFAAAEATNEDLLDEV